jgi:alpha-L-arabinofuranosidase
MKLFHLIVVLLGICLITCQCSSPAEPDLSLIVTEELHAETPVSDLLYSHFIEIGFGYQIAPIQAERFFNRSFEPFVPYTGKSKNSFGFLLPEGKYIKDWSGESWYHSGYEHNSWYAAPGIPPDPAYISDSSTFFVEESSQINVFIKAIDGGMGHGQQCLEVKNLESERWGGVAQDGKYLEEGKSYHFNGHLKSKSGSTDIKLLIYPEGEWESPVIEKSLTINKEYQSYEVDFRLNRSTGRYTFALFIAPGAQVHADALSLLPEDHFFGWKPSTVETIKKLNPGLIRFPGGCFASFYGWKDGVGPNDQRKPEPSYFWGGLNNNDLGTNEFAMLCIELDMEMMLCINIYHPNKLRYLTGERNPWQYRTWELPQFTDIEKGITDAADWVAYCNLEQGEHPMADLRAEHGFPEPHNVKYWEMDNETVRWMSPEEYAKIVVRYSEAMKAIDPTIKIGMVTYDFTESVPEMLEIAGGHIDFFADRDDFEDGRLDHMISLINNYNADHGTDIKYCNTEWQVHPYGAPNPKEEVDERFLYGHQTNIKRAMVLGTWYCGLKAAGYLMDWQRKGDVVNFVNYNNFSNTHGQAVLETPKEGAYLTAPGKLYELISRSPAKWPLKIEGYSINRTDTLQGQVSYTLNKDSLVVYALNRSDSTRIIEFDLNAIPLNIKQGQFTMLDADDIMARTKLDLPDEIRKTDWEEKISGKTLRVECPPRSFIQVVGAK